jgi:hypothetical protein
MTEGPDIDRTHDSYGATKKRVRRNIQCTSIIMFGSSILMSSI